MSSRVNILSSIRPTVSCSPTSKTTSRANQRRPQASGSPLRFDQAATTVQTMKCATANHARSHNTMYPSSNVPGLSFLAFLRGVLICYAGLCAVLLSFVVLQSVLLTHQVNIQGTQAAVLSELHFLDRSALMSKVVREPPGTIDPYVLRENHPGAITACATLRHSELTSFQDWIHGWKDISVSLVVATDYPPHSPSYSTLLDSILNLPSLSSNLSVHLVNHHGRSAPDRSVLLNLARLFALSPKILMLPNMQQEGPTQLKLPRSGSLPVLFLPTTRKVTRMSPPSVDPLEFGVLYLHRDESPWCHENGLDSNSGDGWRMCVELMWLLSYGSMRVLPLETVMEETVSDHLAVELKSHHHGEEACGIAYRHLIGSGQWFLHKGHKKDSPEAAWLKSQCQTIL